MNLKQWAERAQLKPHKTSRKEIESLFAIVERDLKDARSGDTSADGRYVSAYNAALKLCVVLLYVSGFRTSGVGAHLRTIEALPMILGESFQGDADFLDDCRTKRNHAEYDYVDVVEEKSDTLEFLGDTSGRPLTLGGLLESIRLGEEISRAAFARKIGISPSQLRDIEKGRRFIGLK